MTEVVISLLLIVCYVFFFGKYVFSSNVKTKETNSQNIPVSIIVVVRNEEQNIHNLIKSLICLDYNSSAIELLFFDDSSTDNTLKLLYGFLSEVDFSWNVFSGKELNISGKKAAISFLSERACGEYLFFTDGDVVVPQNWVSAFVGHFSIPEVQMICGGVRFSNTQTFIEKLLAIEFAAMIQTSLSAINNHFPFMCNAANMAARKSTILNMTYQKGKSLSSGDDTFLLQSICESYGEGAIVADFNTMVNTISPSSLKEFIHQRIRWAGKSSKSFWINSFVVALLVFAISLWLIVLSVLSFSNHLALICFMVVFLCKSVVDFCVLKKYRVNFSLFKGGLAMSFMLSLVYPWYVVLVALLSLKHTYLWKGRMVE